MQKKGPSASEGLVAACGAFIAANGRLLPIFMKVLWLRTNVYRTEDVYQSFTFLDYWMTVNVEYHTLIPDNFDHKFLCLGIQRVLECDLVLSKAQALWFLYRQLDRLQPAQRDTLLMSVILNSGIFQGLILHWNALIRKIFSYVLVFQVLPNADPVILNSVHTLLASTLGSARASEVILLTRGTDHQIDGEINIVVDSRLLRYRELADSAIIEALQAYGSWRQTGNSIRPNLHVPLLFGLERDAEPSPMH